MGIILPVKCFTVALNINLSVPKQNKSRKIARSSKTQNNCTSSQSFRGRRLMIILLDSQPGNNFQALIAALLLGFLRPHSIVHTRSAETITHLTNLSIVSFDISNEELHETFGNVKGFWYSLFRNQMMATAHWFDKVLISSLSTELIQKFLCARDGNCWSAHLNHDSSPCRIKLTFFKIGFSISDKFLLTRTCL